MHSWLRVNLGWIMIFVGLGALGLWNNYRVEVVQHESDLRVRNQLFLTSLMMYSPHRGDFIRELQLMMLSKERIFPLDGLTVKVSIPKPGVPSVRVVGDTMFLNTFIPSDSHTFIQPDSL